MARHVECLFTLRGVLTERQRGPRKISVLRYDDGPEDGETGSKHTAHAGTERIFAQAPVIPLHGTRRFAALTWQRGRITMDKTMIRPIPGFTLPAWNFNE